MTLSPTPSASRLTFIPDGIAIPAMILTTVIMAYSTMAGIVSILLYPLAAESADP